MNKIWIFGQGCSGKTTLANALAAVLNYAVVDGDEVRKLFNNDLGYDRESRMINFERILSVANEKENAIVSTVTPYREQRLKVKEARYFVVWLDCPLNVRQQRDVKGLYKKAANGELENFIDVSGFEPPASFDEYSLALKTNEQTIEQCIEKILLILKGNSV